MDWLAGLGQGFSNIAPAIQMMMMLQEAKAERDARDRERQQDIAFRTSESEKSRAQTQVLADRQTQLERERAYTEPLARQGMFIDPAAYTSANRIPAPSLEGVGINPLENIGQVATQAAQGANDAQGRLSQLRAKAAQALQQANLAGPGHVQSFEGGMAIGQQPFPNQSTSTSTSYTGVVPDQLRLREQDQYIDGLNSFISKAIANFRAVNPYGAGTAEEQRVINEAIERFPLIYDAARKKIFGNNEPIQGGGGTVRESSSGGVDLRVPQAPPPVIPQNPGQIDLRNTYRNMVRRRQF